MFSKSASSILVAFFMIVVTFTGCLDDAEEVEESLSDEVKCLLITGEYKILELETTASAGMSSSDEKNNVVKGYIKFSNSYYQQDVEKCILGYNIVDADSNLHVNSDNSVYEYMAEISGDSSNMVIIDTDGSIILDDDIEEYSGSLDASGNITLSGVAALIPCDGCFNDAKKGELVVGIDGNAPGEGAGCIDYEDENGNGLYDSGEPCNDDNSPISYTVTVDSLEEVFNKMYQEDDGGYYYTENKWVIHDISEIVEIDGMLMFGVTGKEQADGYDCGLETWYIFPGDSTFTPGQCLLREKPSWHAEYVPSNDGALWAPNFHGSYTMYYTLPMSNEESHSDTQSCMGMVTATGIAPNLVWTDHGEPILCQVEGEDNNEDPEPPALDPAIFTDDDGRMYVVYGGAHIWITELNPETGEHISGDPFSWDNGDNGDYVHLSNGAEDDPLYTEDDMDPWAEAPYIHKEGDYYYLFVNWYSCCMGPDSTYEIVVGRSQSVTGPYLDDEGTDMLDFGGKVIISEDSHNVIGPGHAGIFEYEHQDGNVQVFTHHYYPADEIPWAYAHARTLSWDSDGWPVVSQDEWDPMHYWGITDDSDDETEESSGSCMADSECGEGQVCQQGQCVDEEPETISAEEFYASIMGTFLDGDEDTFYSFFEGDNITLWGGESLAKSEIRTLDNNLCDDSSDEYCFPLGENYTQYTMEDFNLDYNILTVNYSQISEGQCAFYDSELTDEENKEQCLEFTESMNWGSTFGEDDYMANIEWKHEDDGSSSKWIWDDITVMVISEVEGNWQISWWLGLD
tara:strand:- start:43 stop:2430 length:2388 start_codon:yes stop_codon:yes gene_type:complete